MSSARTKSLTTHLHYSQINQQALYGTNQRLHTFSGSNHLVNWIMHIQVIAITRYFCVQCVWHTQLLCPVLDCIVIYSGLSLNQDIPCKSTCLDKFIRNVKSRIKACSLHLDLYEHQLLREKYSFNSIQTLYYSATDLQLGQQLVSLADLPGDAEGPCTPPHHHHHHSWLGSNKLFCHDLYNYLSKYNIEPDSYVPLVMVCHFQSIIEYTTRKSILKMTSGLEH